MKLEQLQEKKIIIIGFGVEGKATYEYLRKYLPGKKIAIADKTTGGITREEQLQYDIAIKSPGIHREEIAIPFTTATNIFFANVTGTTIGITGSKGKSTTAGLMYSILKTAGKQAHLVGNITHKLDPIGEPMLKGLLRSNSPDDMWVCELSSFQTADLAYSPHIAIITSFFPEHMDFHGTENNYWEAKKNIISHAKADDYYVYNPRFERLTSLAENSPCHSFAFTESLSFPDNIIPLQGEHNRDNVRGAVTAARILHISESDITRGIKNFIPLPHRLELVGTFQGVTFYDDAISTTPQSTIKAIESLKQVKTIFLGGQDRGYDFSELAATIISYGIENIVLFPQSGETIARCLQQLTDKSFHTLRTQDMKKAVEFGYTYTPKGSICLLSTASPSFSVWKNFEEKGNLFKKEVKSLAETRSF